jgi:RNA polymerase sigma-70 factor, ECF subfamily
MDSTDAELVIRARRGDRDAFELLIRRHLRTAYSVALGMLANPADAEDACQDAYVTALRKLDTLREPERFKAWLLQIVRSRAIDFRRQAYPEAGIPLDRAGVLVAGGGGPGRDAERSELRERLTRALDRLPEREREIVVLHDLEGWKHREIGEKLGLPEGTVRYLLSMARKALRSDLDEELLES